MSVAILTWHAMHVSGPGYAENDHEAFRQDLETLHALGRRIVALGHVVDALLEGRLDDLGDAVALTFDDAPDFDYYDLPHPAWGPQRSMHNILRDFREAHGSDAPPTLHATSFAIVSREARRSLDRSCMIGCDWWRDDWWPKAEASGLMSVESHGWDHNHETLEKTATAAPRGGFDIRDPDEAQAEIDAASRALCRLRGREGPVLFAYPYGEASPYLADEYLPRYQERHGVRAAFTAGGGFVTNESSRWRIPRFVFRQHWKSPAQLRLLLAPSRVAADAPAHASWRDHLRTYEVNDASRVAGWLFERCFHHPIPDYPRHFVLVYSPPPGSPDAEPRVVAYVHQSPFEEVYLCGGMCVDEHAYRRFPPWLFREVRREGGLATIITRDSMAMLGDSPASFGHVGEPRARAADLRTGFVDTGHTHLMVMWLKDLPEDEKRSLIARVKDIGPF